MRSLDVETTGRAGENKRSGSVKDDIKASCDVVNYIWGCKPNI
jgi:hypothetical protein